MANWLSNLLLPGGQGRASGSRAAGIPAPRRGSFPRVQVRVQHCSCPWILVGRDLLLTTTAERDAAADGSVARPAGFASVADSTPEEVGGRSCAEVRAASRPTDHSGVSSVCA